MLVTPPLLHEHSSYRCLVFQASVAAQFHQLATKSFALSILLHHMAVNHLQVTLLLKTTHLLPKLFPPSQIHPRPDAEYEACAC